MNYLVSEITAGRFQEKSTTKQQRFHSSCIISFSQISMFDPIQFMVTTL